MLISCYYHDFLQVLNLGISSHFSQKQYLASDPFLWNILISYKFIKNCFWSKWLKNITWLFKQHEPEPFFWVCLEPTLTLSRLFQEKSVGCCCIFKTHGPYLPDEVSVGLLAVPAITVHHNLELTLKSEL